MTESLGAIPEKEKKEVNEGKENLPIECAVETRAHEGEERNEDSVLRIDEFGVFGVFDGLGGHRHGDVASQLAVSSIEEYLRDNYHSGMPIEEIKSLFREAFAGANSAILVKRKEDKSLEHIGTTGTMIKVGVDSSGAPYCVVAHIGDCRVYVWDRGELEQITTDDDALHDSHFGSHYSTDEKYKIMQILSNATSLSEIPLEFQFFHENRKIVTKYLGHNATDLPKVFVYPLRKNSRIIITSDGIHDNPNNKDMAKIMESSSSAKEAAKRLLQKAVSVSLGSDPDYGSFRAKPDDMTVIEIDLKAK